jgi:UDP-N-acetylmuramate dehydrogenase
MLLDSLQDIPGLTLRADAPLAELTRFGIGGAADLLAEAVDSQAFLAALRVCRAAGVPFYIIGDGSNLIVSDRGYRGVVLRLASKGLVAAGTCIVADAGAPLQALVDAAIDRGLAGLETLTGIPGSVGAAVYGNAGAYGHSLSERVTAVEVFDGETLRTLSHSDCEFEYRESVFKRHKNWIILRVTLQLEPGDRAGLRTRADEIRLVRDEKFPPTMRCAGSIFKNLLVINLPAAVVAAIPPHAIREGKVASAYFLDQVGAKGMRLNGIQVADYHANLIYNAGGGTAADLRAIIADLRERVRTQFGIVLEEEVQYLGE